MKKICLIGSAGQLGSEIQFIGREYPNLTVIPSVVEELDITNAVSVNQFFSDNEFDIVVNCAAYTAVDLAEKEQEENNLVNNLAVKNLANACEKNDVFLIHVSTDFVFDGTSCIPLVETDKTNPIQEYGKAKLKGEQWVQYGIVIRTSWLYSTVGNNFVKTMMRLGKERDTLNVVANQVGTPTSALDLAKCILDICASEDFKSKKGLYHYSNEGVASWYDFAQAIMEYGGINCAVYPIPDSQYPTPAKRPKYSVMDKTKIKNTFDVDIPYWRKSVQVCIDKIRENES